MTRRSAVALTLIVLSIVNTEYDSLRVAVSVWTPAGEPSRWQWKFDGEGRYILKAAR